MFVNHDPQELESYQKEAIKIAFDTFDTNKTHALDLHEFRFACRSLGFEVSKSKAVKFFDILKTEFINFEDFMRIAKKYMLRKAPEELVQEAFKNLDYDNDGKINAKDLSNAFYDLKIDPTNETIENMLNEFSSKHDGKISYHDFHEIFFPTK